MKKRNSLIELYRFLFAMNVVVGHGLFPVQQEHFRTERVSVEFFFILSGFLFCGFLKKLSDMKPLQAVRTTLISKLKPLMVPVIIGLISNAILNVISDHKPKIEIFRYLWYIPAMLAVMLLYAVLRTVIKSDKAFWCVTGGLFFVATALRFSGNETLFYFDYIRSTSAVSLGMLLAKIPKLKVKCKIIPWLMVIPAAAAIFPIMYNNLVNVSVGYEALLNLVLYPVLIYASFEIDFNFAPFNYLGALSFGIYAYQCPARLIDYIGVPSWIPFVVVIVASVADDLVRRIVKNKKQKSPRKKKSTHKSPKK